jgi:hypothetical protein
MLHGDPQLASMTLLAVGLVALGVVDLLKRRKN